MITVNANITIYHLPPDAVETMNDIQKRLADLKELIQTMGSEARQLLDAINTATNNIAQRIDTLIANQPDMADDVKSELGAIRDHLQSLASDPNNPTPPAP